ncbi:MAG: MFS transporter [Solirubrobacteraceae bacterium MAG38_C4-C5]|nr:MFS transporter [Candidatus Siliceabacter maunaloa]
MSTGAPAVDRTVRRRRRSWYVYDWANSAFATSVAGVFLGPYLTELAQAAADPDGFVRPLGLALRAEAIYPYLVSLAALGQIVFMPAVASLADRTGRRRLTLGITAFLGAFATMALWFVQGEAYLLGGGLFVLAAIAFGCSVSVYNAFLPGLAPPDERDTVSARGWALGYVGGGLLLAAHLALFTLAETDVLALQPSEAVRLSLLTGGAWWALFTIVPLVGLRSGPVPTGAAPSPAQAPAGGHSARAALRELRGAPMVLLFLGAYLLYNDGVQTVVSQAAVFATEELELGQGVVAAAFLIVQFAAIGGALALGALAVRHGAKRVILASLVVWVAVLGAAVALPAGQVAPLIVLSVLIGLVLGGTQALSRSLFSHMAPAGREAAAFSLFEIAGRATTWLGPLLFGLSVQLTGSYRVAIASLVVFFVAGFVALALCDVRRAVVQAGNVVPERL